MIFAKLSAPLKKDKAVAVIERCLDFGVTYFDAANGEAEQIDFMTVKQAYNLCKLIYGW